MELQILFLRALPITVDYQQYLMVLAWDLNDLCTSVRNNLLREYFTYRTVNISQSVKENLRAGLNT